MTMPWEVIDNADAVHVLPLGGDETHEPDIACWCSPRVEILSRPMVTHRGHGESDRDEDKASEP